MESKEQVRSDVEILFNEPKRINLGLRNGDSLGIELREPTDAELDEYLDLFADAYKDIIMVFVKGQQNALKDSDIDITKIKKLGAKVVARAIGKEESFVRENLTKRQVLECTAIMLDLIGWDTIQTLFGEALRKFNSAKPVGDSPAKPPFVEQ